MIFFILYPSIETIDFKLSLIVCFYIFTAKSFSMLGGGGELLTLLTQKTLYMCLSQARILLFRIRRLVAVCEIYSICLFFQ